MTMTTMMTYKFYDTSALIEKEKLLPDEQIIISSITLEELEKLKTSNTIVEDLRMQVRHTLNLIDTNQDVVHYIIYEQNLMEPFKSYSGDWNNDLKIIACAKSFLDTHPEGFFVTNDRSQRLLAKHLLPTHAAHIKSEEKCEEPIYTGYKVVTPDDMELAEFYSNLENNTYQLLTNQYLVIMRDNQVMDQYIWTGKKYIQVHYKVINSIWFGEVKPKANDFSQILAIDSLTRNKFTLLTGPAGSGKSLLSMSYLFQQLERGKIDKIVIFCNPVATKDSARLGFYPGTRTDKLLDSQIGNFLMSKLGSREAIETMIEKGTLILLPFSDIRGYDTSGMNCGVYITEAQNLNINLMKLALQRIGEDSVCIVEGDVKTQVDLLTYEGSSNGMRRVAEVYKGESCFGAVELKKIHRSTIGAIADKM